MRQGIERQRPLTLEVRDELERMILDGDVAAGERLNELTLAEQMGVSRGPVREAARSLERDGLVTTVANQGVFVRELSLDDALELYDLRAMIAGYLCGRVAERADAEVNLSLRQAVARMDAAIAAANEPLYFELNLAFHDKIASAAGRGRAQRLYASLGKEVRLLRRRVLCGEEFAENLEPRTRPDRRRHRGRRRAGGAGSGNAASPQQQDTAGGDAVKRHRAVHRRARADGRTIAVHPR